MGQRTAVYQMALGCGSAAHSVGAAMFRGLTALAPAERVEEELIISEITGCGHIQL